MTSVLNHPGAAILALTLLAALSGAAATAAGENADPLDAFPAAAAGQVRYVINLPPMDRPEEHFSVELIAGRVIRTDGVNQLRMDTRLEPRPLPGWGYTFYEMTGSGQTASTLMAVPEGAEPVDAFVGGQRLTVRYSSRLPIVVYAPDGFEIRYRIWAAAESYLPAGPG